MEPVEEKIGPHLWKEELKMAQETDDAILFGKDSSSRLDICFSRCQRTARVLTPTLVAFDYTLIP